MNIAAVTMAYNESIYLPIWARYYANKLGANNLYVIDHGSTDDSLSYLPRGVNVTRLPRGEAFDEVPRTAFVNYFARALLKYHDVVIYNDSDELVVLDPEKYRNFSEFFEASPPVVAPVGLHLFQALDREAEIDLAYPILGQRRFCQFSGAMCKPTMIKTPVEWSLGFHSSSYEPHFSNDAFLFHLKSIDKTQSLDRLSKTRSMQWSASNIEHKISHHHRTEDDAHVNAFFNSPLTALQETSDLSFDFTVDIERMRSALAYEYGVYQSPNFNGKVAQVPERFFGLF